MKTQALYLPDSYLKEMNAQILEAASEENNRYVKKDSLLINVGTVADGGTQVHSTKEVGKIEISSMSEQDGTTVVEYRVI